MFLNDIKCNIFFMISFLSLMLFLSCKSDQNTVSNIETTIANNSPVTELKSSTKNSVILEIDDAALAELDQWTSFFMLQKEIEKLEKNIANGFQENEKRIETYFKDLKLNAPEIFNTNTTWARLKVLETELYLYNEIFNAQESQELIKTARQNILSAYQNLVRQINKIYEKSTQNIAE